MTIDHRFIPAFSIEDVLLDKDTGAPLSGGIVTFWRDSQRGMMKDVYQITGTYPLYTFTALTNPMILSSIGTFEDSLGNPVVPYFLPYIGATTTIDLYYITVESSGNVPQFTREAVPFVPDTGGDVAISGAYQNELSNPQFATVLFEGTAGVYQYNFSAGTTTVEIAPNWSLEVVSAGASSVTLTQNTPPGTENILTNPGTSLRIQPVGTSTLKLRQRLFGSPNLWGQGFISATFLAANNAGTAVVLPLKYSQSNGTYAVTPATIISATLPPGGAFAAYPGSVQILQSTSSEFYPGAYVDIYFDIPSSSDITISSVMVASTGTVSVGSIIYDQESNDRQVDHLFHYYKPQLFFKPIPSYLVGWNFEFNPCQELGPNPPAAPTPPIALANKSRYIADQTILFSTVQDVISMSLVFGGFQFTTSSNTSFAIIQYIDPPNVVDLLKGRMAVYLQGKATAGLPCEINIYWTQDVNVPDLNSPNYNSLITLVSSTAVQSVVGTWNKIPRTQGRGDAKFTLAASSANSAPAYMFNGWDDTTNAGITTATYMAIVVSFGTLATTNTVTLDNISLCAGDIATEPAPQSFGQTLLDCQRYYETNYPSGSAASGANMANNLVFPMGLAIAVTAGSVGAIDVEANSFGFQFRTLMRVAPVVTLYSQAGTAGNVSLKKRVNGVNTGPSDTAVSSFWTINSTNITTGVYYEVSNSNIMSAGQGGTGVGQISAYIACNYILEARIGKV